MLQLSKTFIEVPILSLRVGGPVGTALAPIINPINLKIEGWHSISETRKGELVLLSQDVREILPQGFAVNDEEVLTAPSELVRLREILKADFPLIGMPVVTEDGQKLGKVSDFAAESTTFYIQKLYTQASLFRSLKDGSATVERQHIVEITNRKIVVRNPLKPTRVKAAPQQRQPRVV